MACCEFMKQQEEWICTEHNDPWDCDVPLVRGGLTGLNKGWLIPIRDGGRSGIRVNYCPCCGACLKETIHLNSFVKRQTPESQFSHYNGTWEDLEELTHEALLDPDNISEGYRSGVILVKVSPTDFYSSTITLNPGDQLCGEYISRKLGEEPRKHIYVKGKKQPAKFVQIVLYSHEVLKENNEHESNAQWEIISINASLAEHEPIPTGALIANHFELSGGTSTKMTDEEFVKQLKESVLYWKDKAHVKE